MIISRGRNYIFVHIPKTGGTAMAAALERRAMADDILVGDTPKARRRRGRLKGLATAGRLWKHSTLADIDGLVTRDESQRAHIYAAAVSEPSTQQRLVDDLLERAFGGSARRLVMQALDSDRVSDDELDDIRALLDQLDAQTDDDSDASTA